MDDDVIIFGKFETCSLNYWGRPVLTGCVMASISMQAHGMRALKDSPAQIIGEENSYAMAA